MNTNLFWKKVAIHEESCWVWMGCRFPNGYGQFHNRRAHRISWELQRGTIPLGLLVLHHCDNKLCVRLDHLFVGTQLDNVRDMFSKGRENKAKGEKHWNSKLSSDAVNEIRKSECTQIKIAKKYGISRSAVSLIKTGKRWAHI